MSSPPQLAMYQVALLRRSRHYDDFDEESRERIFREHLAYTLSMVASGEQLAAGPVQDSPDEEENICGLGVYQKDSLDEARKILANDPGVRQELYTFDVMTWLSAPGVITPPAGWSPG
jgi:uncharacterized protein YciI